MPIRIPDSLPARKVLEQEGVMLMSDSVADRQDIRPLHIVLLNLMPDKERTETQFARLVGATPLQIEMHLMRMGSHEAKNASPEHMLAFYRTFAECRDMKFDGMIISGAPVEHLAFREVGYWRELCELLEWSASNVHSTMSICWGAQAALYHFHGIDKHSLAQKAFGVYRHDCLNPASQYLRGFSDDFVVPVSRWTETRMEDLTGCSDLEVLMASRDTGPCLVYEENRRFLYMFNHLEYDSTTLAGEYWRDHEKDSGINVPSGYFPDDDPRNIPRNRWRSHAHLLFGNWINDVYQTTPYDLAAIGK